MFSPVILPAQGSQVPHCACLISQWVSLATTLLRADPRDCGLVLEPTDSLGLPHIHPKLLSPHTQTQRQTVGLGTKRGASPEPPSIMVEGKVCVRCSGSPGLVLRCWRGAWACRSPALLCLPLPWAPTGPCPCGRASGSVLLLDTPAGRKERGNWALLSPRKQDGFQPCQVHLCRFTFCRQV